MSATGCPDQSELKDYAVGKLPDGASEAVAIHLESCPACRAELGTLSDPDDTLIGLLRRPVAPDPYLDELECRQAIARAKGVLNQSGATGEASPDTSASFPEQLGEYHLLGWLGGGAMGMVYKALHLKLDRIVALKVLPPTRTEDPLAVTRFEREMKAIGRLDHPHIVRAYDAQEIQGRLVLAMEFVEGLDLAKILRRLGRLEPAEACEVARQAALGLQAAHELGLVHRDVKPSNLMLTLQGQVKVLDLGLARWHGQAFDDEEATGSGQILGTADYMAPEQSSDSRAVDIRADIYGLGCTLYKLLSGRAPFGGPEHPDAPDKLAAHRRAPVPPIRQLRPEIPAGLAAVLDCMLAKDREARYSTPADVAEALGPWSAGADLTGLLRRAAEAEEDAGAERISCARSAPAVQAADKWRPPSAFRRWKSPAKLVGLMFLVGAIGLVLGITIRFRKDGQETTIDVPLGSTTRIGADGHVDVSLSERRNAVSAVAVPDRTAIPDAGRAAERGEGSANILSNSAPRREARIRTVGNRERRSRECGTLGTSRLPLTAKQVSRSRKRQTDISPSPNGSRP